MHDWQEVVRRKLASAALSRRRREDLSAELANHLEDTYGELLACGVSEPEALAKCLEESDDVPKIAAAVTRSQFWEDAMNQRSRTLWLPGLVTLTLASVLLMLMERFAFSRARVYWVDGVNVEFGLFWLLSLVPCGALGAYMSCRAGRTPWNSILASLFPSLTMLGVFCVVLPIAIFIERNTYVIHHLRPFGLALLAWTVVPGVPSLLGALPVLWKKNNRVHTDATPHIA